ncbi:MAG: cadherin domain-containing protein [Verrucomicrobia bacterium]|nr:cadherin domain-containing protein [Verrucomicrobiota bacterium]
MFSSAIPPNWPAKDYTLHAVVWSGTPGSSTWLNDARRNFTVLAQTTAATITVRAISAVIQGNQLSVTCDVRNDGNVSRTFGVGAEIKDGATLKADLGSQTTSSIAPSSSSSVSFTYAIPADWTAKDYTLHAVAWSGTPGSSTWLDDANATFTVLSDGAAATITIRAISAVIQGNQLSVTCDVRNDGNVSRTFGVGAEIKDGATLKADLGSQTTSSIGPSSSSSVSFTYTIPAAWTAKDYTLHAVVWSGTPGSSTWLNSSDRTFTVSALPLNLHGRIAYHTYSQYLAVPTLGDTTDGRGFVYNLDNQQLLGFRASLAVVNVMNPHFSPDGSKVVFMAVPQNKATDVLYDPPSKPYWHRKRSNLDIFLYDLADDTLVNLTPNEGIVDEDPKFSPDALYIIWKTQGQIWRMRADGTERTQLTFSPDDASAPYFSPNGAKIAYSTSVSGDSDIWIMNANGSGAVRVVGNVAIQDYYPVYKDDNNLLYSRWESSSDQHDKLYNLDISLGTSSRLPLNITGVEDADACPAGSTYLAFSSTRSGKGSYDIFVARYDNGATFTLGTANSVHADLGATYSPFTYARKLTLQAPLAGAGLTVGAAYFLQVCADSDGVVWSGASPSVTFQGPVTATYSDLRDDGTGGDSVAGDGIYSKSITLPTTAGTYSVTASAQSSEPGVSRTISSSLVQVILSTPNSTPTDIALSPSSVQENQPPGTTVGTLSTTDPDSGNTFTCSLVGGSGSINNASFTINGSTLKTLAAFDYETKASYSIRVRTTDQGGLPYEKAFTITVADVAEAPITPTNISPSEGATGQLLTVTLEGSAFSDPDAGDIQAASQWAVRRVSDGGIVFDSGEDAVDKESVAIPSGALTNAGSYAWQVRYKDNHGLWSDFSVQTTFSTIPASTRIISLSGDLAFGNVAVGSSSNRTFTIWNTGNSTLTVSNITYPSGFSGNWSWTVPAGGSTNVPVTFLPVFAMSYNGSLEVISDATSGTNTMAVSGTGVAYNPPFMNDGLVAYYPFNENANDATGNGFNGTVVGALPTTDRFAFSGGAYLFDGSNSRIDMAGTEGLNPTNNQLTVSAWVLLNSLPPQALIVGKHQCRVGTGYLLMCNGGHFEFYVQRDSIISPQVCIVGIWYHVVGVLNGTSRALYVNGEQVASGTAVTMQSNDNIIQVGTLTTGDCYPNHLSGKIDDVRIYHRAFSTPEVVGLYAYESDPPVDLKAGLVAHYQFVGNASDATTNGNNGTPHGGSFASDWLGRASSAYYFDGNTEIEVPNSDSLKIGGTNITMAAWVYPTRFTGGGSRRTILRKIPQSVSTGGYLFALSNEGQPHFGFVSDTYYQASCATTILPLSQWSHVAVTYDGVSAKFFVNGVLAESAPQTHRIAVDNTTLCIGELSPTYLSEEFYGKLADLRLYNRTLLATEVSRLYTPASATLAATCQGTNLILIWPTNALSFTLESAANLGPSAVWGPVSPGPAIVNGQFILTNALSGQKQFFRLRKQ